MSIFKSLLATGAMVFFLTATAVGLDTISMISLIANPDNYHGKKVRVIGYLSLAPERAALFLSRDDEKHGITKNAIYLVLPEAEVARHHKENHEVFLVEGTFDAGMKGHGAMYSGVIKDITRIERWE